MDNLWQAEWSRERLIDVQSLREMMASSTAQKSQKDTCWFSNFEGKHHMIGIFWV